MLGKRKFFGSDGERGSGVAGEGGREEWSAGSLLCRRCVARGGEVFVPDVRLVVPRVKTPKPQCQCHLLHPQFSRRRRLLPKNAGYASFAAMFTKAKSLLKNCRTIGTVCYTVSAKICLNCNSRGLKRVDKKQDNAIISSI